MAGRIVLITIWLQIIAKIPNFKHQLQINSKFKISMTKTN